MFQHACINFIFELRMKNSDTAYMLITNELNIFIAHILYYEFI